MIHPMMYPLGKAGKSGSTTFTVCTTDQIDENGSPIVENPIEGSFYLTPTGETSPNLFNEWVYTNGNWEMFGSATIDLTDYVKSTDYASASVGGVVKLNRNVGGIYLDSDNILRFVAAQPSHIDAKVATGLVITPSVLDYAVKVGVTTNTNTLTEDEKAAAQTWLGVGAVVQSTDAAQVLTPNTQYVFGEMATLAPALGTSFTGIVNEYKFSFTSGATATVLTLPDGVVSDLVVEPNRRYECSIVDNYLAWADWAV